MYDHPRAVLGTRDGMVDNKRPSPCGVCGETELVKKQIYNIMFSRGVCFEEK